MGEAVLISYRTVLLILEFNILSTFWLKALSYISKYLLRRVLGRRDGGQVPMVEN